MTETWRIAKSAYTCADCAEQFAEGQPFYSSLFERADGFGRRDLCLDCWQMRDGPTAFCHWKSRRPYDGKKQRVDTDVLLEFFDRLDSPGNERKRIFRFVLALYLMRRRELKLLGVERADGRESLAFERRSDGERLTVDDPGLTEEQVQQTAATLSSLLDTEL